MRRSMLIIGFLFAAVLSTHNHSEPFAHAHQINAPTDPALSYGLIVDCSGSMKNQNLHTYLYDATKLIVRANKPDDETFLVTFAASNGIATVRPFTRDIKSLLKGIDEGFYIQPGQTALYDAIYLSAQYLSKNSNSDGSRRKALVLITDGEDRNSYYSEKQLFKLLRRTNAKVYIFSVTELIKAGLNQKKYSTAIEFQNKLAAETGGRVFYPQNKDDAIKIIGELLGYIRQQ